MHGTKWNRCTPTSWIAAAAPRVLVSFWTAWGGAAVLQTSLKQTWLRSMAGVWYAA